MIVLQRKTPADKHTLTILDMVTEKQEIFHLIKILISGVARPSWDPLTTLFAVRGASGIGCKEEGFGGHNLVGEEGDNSWVEEDGGKNMSYLVLEEGEDIRIGEVIDDLLCATSSR